MCHARGIFAGFGLSHCLGPQAIGPLATRARSSFVGSALPGWILHRKTQARRSKRVQVETGIQAQRGLDSPALDPDTGLATHAPHSTCSSAVVGSSTHPRLACPPGFAPSPRNVGQATARRRARECSRSCWWFAHSVCLGYIFVFDCIYTRLGVVHGYAWFRFLFFLIAYMQIFIRYH